MGVDFMLGFFSDLAGGEIGELAAKYSLSKIGRGLMNKFGQHYKDVCRYLGGGFSQSQRHITGQPPMWVQLLQQGL